MTDEYFKKCLYCKYFVQGKCCRLAQLVNSAEEILFTVNSYVEGTDFRLIVEENISNPSDELSSKIRRCIEGNARVSKAKLDLIEKSVNGLLNMKFNELLQEIQELVVDSVLELSNLKLDGIEVNREFYCKEWE